MGSVVAQVVKTFGFTWFAESLDDFRNVPLDSNEAGRIFDLEPFLTRNSPKRLGK